MLFAVVTTGHFSEVIRPCHEPPGWDRSQAGDTDLLVPLITSLWCDADSAAHSGRATQ